MYRASKSSFKMLTLALATLAVAATATASAASKKNRAAPSSSTATLCHGTPVIMQGLDCPPQPDRGEWQKHAGERAKHPRLIAPGNNTVYVAPPARTPSLMPLPPVTPYVPPPISNPSERITQFNHSFPLNSGLGNNPTDRDAYIRYNFNR